MLQRRSPQLNQQPVGPKQGPGGGRSIAYDVDTLIVVVRLESTSQGPLKDQVERRLNCDDDDVKGREWVCMLPTKLQLRCCESLYPLLAPEHFEPRQHLERFHVNDVSFMVRTPPWEGFLKMRSSQ